MKTKKLMLILIMAGILIFSFGCRDTPIDPPIDPIDPPIDEKTPLELAFESFEDVTNYTMTITFNSNTLNTYVAEVKMSENAAEVDALDDTIYYEVVQDVCYLYEFRATSWIKSPTPCTDKTNQELSFLNGFDITYFEENTDGDYELKSEFYTALDGFLLSTSTSDFKLSLNGNQFSEISFTMERNEYTFEITIVLSNFNQTTVILPEV
jgi:hypothetical protein